MTTNNQNVTIVVRSTNERTTFSCLDLLRKQVDEENIVCINETPFSKAVQKTFAIGIDNNKDWTLAIDADILVTNDCIKSLINLAETLEDYFFEIQGRVLDKLYGVPRGGGPHLYRTKYLRTAISFIPEEGTSLRPESDTYDAMSEIGYHYFFGKDIYGIHDYEQYYKDLYRKGFIHAKKHWRYLSHFQNYWFENANIDVDFKIALLGFNQAEHYKDTVYVDRNFFPLEINNYLATINLTEKFDLEKVDIDFVEKMISTYLNNSRKLWNFEKQYFNYIKRSDQKLTL